MLVVTEQRGRQIHPGSSHGGTGNSAFGNPFFCTDQTFPEHLKMSNKINTSPAATRQTLGSVSAGCAVQASGYKNEILLTARGLGDCQTLTLLIRRCQRLCVGPTRTFGRKMSKNSAGFIVA